MESNYKCSLPEPKLNCSSLPPRTNTHTQEHSFSKGAVNTSRHERETCEWLNGTLSVAQNPRNFGGSNNTHRFALVYIHKFPILLYAWKKKKYKLTFVMVDKQSMKREHAPMDTARMNYSFMVHATSAWRWKTPIKRFLNLFLQGQWEIFDILAFWDSLSSSKVNNRTFSK